MTDDRFDDILGQAARGYNEPPKPQLDDMWAQVEARAFDAPPLTLHGATHGATPARRRWRLPQWLPVAAALLIGVGLGRISLRGGDAPTARAVASSDADAASRVDSAAAPLQAAASRYLGQTAALLVSLPAEARAGRADARFVSRAGELLLTTRLLMDSPAAADPNFRMLLEDLELVLAQVVRLPQERGTGELELIAEALEQRDVLPRLRQAVAGSSAD